MHSGSQDDGDSETTVRCVFDMRRFTRGEADGGDATGWRFEAGWFRRASGLEWTWFSRTVQEDGTSWK